MILGEAVRILFSCFFLNLLCHHGLAGRFSLFSPLDIANIPRSFPFHFPLEAI